MFLKIALRNLLKRKVFSFINISGLALGLGAGLMIFLFISDELDYDNFYPEGNRIVRIVREHGEGGEKSASATINYRLGELAKQNMSQVQKLTQLSNRVEVKVSYAEKTLTESKVHFTDNQFFQLFGIRFIQGNPKSVLSNPFEAVLTQEAALRIFGEGNALGKTLNIDSKDYLVVGLVEQLPDNAHLHFDYLLSIASTKSFYSEPMFNHWGNIWLYTYVLLNEGVGLPEFDQALMAQTQENGPPELADFGVRFYSQPIEDIHLYSQLSNEAEQNGDIALIRILAAVAVLILLIACFNFINLTTARSAWRSKEVGVKKVLGVRKGQLIRQFLGESIFTTLIAFAVSLLLVLSLLPFFNHFTGKNIIITEVMVLSPVLLVVVTSIGVAAGMISALFLSSFQPVKTLKGHSQGDSFFTTKLRQVLIVLQFSITIILTVGALVIFQQLNFIKSKDLGVSVDDIIVLQLKNKATRNNGEALKNTLNQSSLITSTALSSDVPFEGLNSWRVKPKGVDMPDELISIVAVDKDYLKTLQMEITEQSPPTAYSWDNDQGILVNESFVRHFLITDPIGSEIEIGHIEKPLRIVGVIKDYHFASLHQGIRPLMLYVQPSWYARLIIRPNTSEIKTVLDLAEVTWNEINPDEEMDYFLLEQRFEALYTTEEKTGDLVAYFSFFSLVIACMGLYGLAAYVAESKLKEISVRKILGATLKSLVQLQFRVFVKLIFVASLVAVPAAIWIMNSWLNDFAYSTGISWWIIVLTILSVFVFTAASVGYRSLAAAMTNPTDNLRSE
ncbi:MAG: ABC transporter permease [Bacteroidota bacterium]